MHFFCITLSEESLKDFFLEFCLCKIVIYFHYVLWSLSITGITSPNLATTRHRQPRLIKGFIKKINAEFALFTWSSFNGLSRQMIIISLSPSKSVSPHCLPDYETSVANVIAPSYKNSMWSHLNRLLSKTRFLFSLENSSSSNDLFIAIVPALLCSWFTFIIMIHCCLISRKLFIF